MKDKMDKLLEERENDYNELQEHVFAVIKKWERDSILAPKGKRFDINVNVRPIEKSKDGTYIEIAVPQPNIKGEIKNYIQMIDSESNVVTYIFIL